MTIGALVAGTLLLGSLGFFAFVVWPSASTEPAALPIVESATPSPATVAELPPFIDAWGGYQLTLPDGWRVNDRRSGTHMIRADITRGEFGFQIRVLKNVRAENREAFVQRYIESFVRDMQGHWGGKIEKGELDCSALGTTPGCRVSLFQDRKDGSSYWLGQYVWLREQTAVVFQAGAPRAMGSDARAQIDRIAATFAWTP